MFVTKMDELLLTIVEPLLESIGTREWRILGYSVESVPGQIDTVRVNIAVLHNQVNNVTER